MMTNVRRPIHLPLRQQTSAVTLAAPPQNTCSNTALGSPRPLSPTGDTLPSQILPHLFVGNQEQTNRETLNRLNISYILSLGLLPLISTNVSPTSPTSGRIILPMQNSSKDFKIRIRSSSISPSATSMSPSSNHLMGTCGYQETTSTTTNATSINRRPFDENKGVKLVRSIHCKCINISDNSEQLLTKFFDEAHQFIDEARRKKCNILVHCFAGVSRSPAIAIAYLMRVNSLRLQDAYNLVKQCRPQIDPNFHFMGQLMNYEKSLEIKAASYKNNNNSEPTNSIDAISSMHMRARLQTDR